MAEQNRTRVLILGGEFAGIYTALTLENYLEKIPNLEIGLVSKENYLVFHRNAVCSGPAGNIFKIRQ